MTTTFPNFSAPYAPDETETVKALLARNSFDAALERRIRERAERFVDEVRERSR